MRIGATRWWLRFGAAVLATALWPSLGSRTAEARLQPYYVINGASFNQVKPRVLFVVDTSNSMQRVALDPTIKTCTWNECERPGSAEESRMSAARRAMFAVINQMRGAARFGMMTFDQFDTPSFLSAVPAKCAHLSGPRRFVWLDTVKYHRPSGTTWEPIDHYPGYAGTWAICDDRISANKVQRRPYPYIRRDQLGMAQVIDPSANVAANAPLPDSPLIGTDMVDMKSTFNADRKVQWFPRFMGVRANLNAETDPAREVLRGSSGDYASALDPGAQDREVWNYDFYYWPYVDGFPGYSIWNAQVNDPSYTDTKYNPGVVAGRKWFQGELVQPFALDASELSARGITGLDVGPTTPIEADKGVLALSDSLIRGGVDPHSGGITPWASTIGAVPGSVTLTNAYNSHTTVASYLAFLNDLAGPAAALCTPTSVVVVTDGAPAPATEGGAVLYQRLADLRRRLGAKTYVVGIFQQTAGQLNDMACAGAGACDTGVCSTPCDDRPEDDWDTCADPSNPGTACAFLANSADDLADVLGTIIRGTLDLALDAGPPMVVNEFNVRKTDGTDPTSVQSSVNAYTQWPGWKGHVTRNVCDELDPDDPTKLAAHCLRANRFSAEDKAEPKWGPCPRSRNWDAGECLRLKSWKSRRIYTTNARNVPIRISNGQGKATNGFINQLRQLRLLQTQNARAEADAIVEFILGKDWPGGWKLPGLSRAAPQVVRRIPEPNQALFPPVAIRDPHCSGKELSSASGALPASLVSFAEDAYDDSKYVQRPRPHRPYQEAVIVGDDLGIVHAFHLNSGNEMWGFIPRFLIKQAVAQARYGAARRGQPDALEDHIYGAAATSNQGWVYDAAAAKWRHLLVIGAGPGGSEIVALDVSHMSPNANGGPIEVLWTTEDRRLRNLYNRLLGETWSRPALTYDVETLQDLPRAYLVFGSGYRQQTLPNGNPRGRAVMLVDAVTGDVQDWAKIVPPNARFRYEENYGLHNDVAVSTYCSSRFWAEMQKVYFADSLGSIYRWDKSPDRLSTGVADSGSVWNRRAKAGATFYACRGDARRCAPSRGGTRLAEPFVFSPAVTALDRIDAEGVGGASGQDPSAKDQFLIAAIGGSPYDDKTDPGDDTVDYHPSLFLLVDDHRSDKRKGFTYPRNGDLSRLNRLGRDDHYMRLALTQLTRTRQFTPFPGSPTYTETARFSRDARPTRSPRIVVQRVVDGAGNHVPNVEVFDITYTVYEPGTDQCDVRWYDAANRTWYYDEGSTFEITFRLAADSAQGFSFANGAGNAADFGGGRGGQALELAGVNQVLEGNCADGSCTPQAGFTPRKPCDDNDPDATPPPNHPGFRSFNTGTVSGFTPRG